MKGSRRTWTNDEKQCMQTFYDEDTFIKGKRLHDLANRVQATPRQVKVWFQNKRQRQNPVEVKWYQNGRKEDCGSPEVDEPEAVHEPVVDEPAVNELPVSAIAIQNSEFVDFGLPIKFYFMLATMDDESVHQFSIRCVALSFSIYLLQPMYFYIMMADFIIRTCPDPVRLVLTALQTIVNEIRVRFYVTMDHKVGSLHALECVLMSLGFPMTLS